MVGTGVRVCSLEGGGATRSADGQKGIVCLAHAYAELWRNRGGASGVCRVNYALALLRAESEGTSKGSEGLEGPLGLLRGALEDGAVGVCYGICSTGQVHGCLLFQGPLQGQGKQLRPK
jgi:hypothetical protein